MIFKSAYTSHFTREFANKLACSFTLDGDGDVIVDDDDECIREIAEASVALTSLWEQPSWQSIIELGVVINHLRTLGIGMQYPLLAH